MKKLILLSCIFMSLTSFANERKVLSQEQLKNQLLPKLQKSIVFEKYKPVMVRKGKLGEKIKTYTKDGLETVNSVKDENSYVIRNMTGAKEEYIIKGDKLASRYKFSKKIDNIWSEYKPFGEIKVIKVGNDKEFYIIAPWGEKMIVKKNDFLVSPLDYSEIYRIAHKEFKETYRVKK